MSVFEGKLNFLILEWKNEKFRIKMVGIVRKDNRDIKEIEGIMIKSKNEWKF